MHPFINISGQHIGTYGLCMACAFIVSAICAFRKGKPKGLIIEDLLIVGASALGVGLLLGSLLYALITYPIAQLWEFIKQGDLRFLSSGIVYYGGLIGGLLGALIGVRVAGCSLLVVEHAVVPFIPLGHAIGRIGCVMAGCCHGFAYDGPFALYYPHAISGVSPTQGYFPVQPLESLVNIGICLLLLKLEKRAARTSDLLLSYLGLYAISRFFLEMLRGDEARGFWNVLSTSQIISILLLAVSVIGLLWKKGRHKHKRNSTA